MIEEPKSTEEQFRKIGKQVLLSGAPIYLWQTRAVKAAVEIEELLLKIQLVSALPEEITDELRNLSFEWALRRLTPNHKARSLFLDHVYEMAAQGKTHEAIMDWARHKSKEI